MSELEPRTESRSLDKPTVFVVDDDDAVRKSLRWLLESEGLRVETFENGEVFLESDAWRRPGCLVVDMRMPGMSGLQLQFQLAQRGSRLPMIIVTGHGEVSSAVTALKAGVLDFIEKPFNDSILVESVHKALEKDHEIRQQSFVDAHIANRLSRLSERERSVMQGVIDGKSNKMMATELGLSPKTVEYHRAKMMAKLGADSVAELVRLVMRQPPTH